MKTLLLLLVLVAAFARAACAQEIKPGDSDAPLFVINEVYFDPPKEGEAPHHHAGHAGKLLLTVHSLNDLLLQPDKKGVRVVLNDDDTKTFARLTHQYAYLVLVAGEKTGVVMHISEPIENGSLLFDDSNFATPVATYLRQRFHVKPDSNDFEAAKP